MSGPFKVEENAAEGIMILDPYNLIVTNITEWDPKQQITDFFSILFAKWSL